MYFVVSVASRIFSHITDGIINDALYLIGHLQGGSISESIYDRQVVKQSAYFECNLPAHECVAVFHPSQRINPIHLGRSDIDASFVPCKTANHSAAASALLFVGKYTNLAFRSVPEKLSLILSL